MDELIEILEDIKPDVDYEGCEKTLLTVTILTLFQSFLLLLRLRTLLM